MASVSLIVDLGAGVTYTYKGSANTSLSEVVADAAARAKLSGSADDWTLSYQRKALDRTLSIRFAGLPPGAKVSLCRARRASSSSPAGRGDASVQIALQLVDGQRVIGAASPDTTLWAMLLAFEARHPQLNVTRRSTRAEGKKKLFSRRSSSGNVLVWEEPVLVVMNKEYRGDSLFASTLADIGIVSGSHLMRISFKRTEKSFDELGAWLDSAGVATSAAEASGQVAAAVAAATPDPADAAGDASPAATATTSSGATGYTLGTATASAAPSSAAAAAAAAADAGGASSIERSTVLYKPPNPDTDIDPNKFNVPPEFYEVGENDVRALLAKKPEQQQLMTKAMRDKYYSARKRTFTKARIRVRFADRYQLEGTFRPRERIHALYTWVRDMLQDPKLEFSLYITPPVQHLTDHQATLEDRALVPNAVVIFSLPDGRTPSAAQFVPAELMSAAEDLPADVEMPTYVAARFQKKVPKWFKKK